MKKLAVLTCTLLFINLITYCQSKSTAGFNFYDYNGDKDITADTNGRLSFRLYYGKREGENLFGRAYVYMIHKNGGQWWYNEAKNKYSNKKYKSYLYAEEVYNNPNAWIDYNGYAFFIDKKDLGPQSSAVEDGSTITEYYPRYPCTIILYECKAGTKQWVEIKRKTFQTEKEHTMWEWESTFIKKKLEESNLPKN